MLRSMNSSIMATNNSNGVNKLNGGDSDNNDELQYLRMIKTILEEGLDKPDRTGTGTLSIFGSQLLKFNLRDDTMPLLTTKRVFWRGVVHELLWFISGSTDSKVLHDKGVHIWDANGSKEFLTKSGFPEREEGDLGPVYGFQWRHFGAEYIDKHTNYNGQGVDQLKILINDLKTNPHSRRHILTAWNPCDIPLMALPPCHCFVQFYVNPKNELSCKLDQRSADVGLGIPFNIASYALLTHMIAHLTKLTPGDFFLSIGDAHIYKNHVDQLKEQLQRTPTLFPTISFKRQVSDIDDFNFDDIELHGYKPQATIQMEMSV